MKTTKEMISVMQAYERGEVIECRSSNDAWFTYLPEYGRPTWNWSQFDYRIKPKPRVAREWWIIAEDSYKDSAYRVAQVTFIDDNKAIHVREILDEPTP